VDRLFLLSVAGRIAFFGAVLAGCKTPISTGSIDPAMLGGCIRAVSCPLGAAVPGESLSACMWRNESFIDNFFASRRVVVPPQNAGFPPVQISVVALSCANAAPTCDQFAACFFGPKPTYCADNPNSPGACAGDFAIWCTAGSTDTRASDCAGVAQPREWSAQRS